MKKPTSYTLRPARGQALLSYQGGDSRLTPKSMPLYEADLVEKARPNGQEKLNDNGALNHLLHGDCLSACAWLKSQNMAADLVYIDPPFASGANYAKTLYLRGVGKLPDAGDSSLGEEVLYGDIWQKEDYLNWLYERLLAIREIMSETGSIYVHLDWHIGHYVKVLMDEVFGEENFLNEIIWHYTNKIPDTRKRKFTNASDTILSYRKSDENVFNHQFEKRDKPIKVSKMKKVAGKKIYLKDESGKGLYEERTERTIDNVWNISLLHAQPEILNYPTQKPEALLRRIIEASSDEGMLVADFFSGSGTTAKVAHDLGRRFVACDIGLNGVQTTRDRLFDAGAHFDILKVKDGVRLFRNPAQTEKKIFSLIPGWQSGEAAGIAEFWDGAIADEKGDYVPVKYIGIEEKLTMKTIGAILTAAGESDAANVTVIYAHKDAKVTQAEANKEAQGHRRSNCTIRLFSLDELLGEKQLFGEDSAEITVSKDGKNGCRVVINRFYSPYLQKKIYEHNARQQIKLGEKTLKITVSDSALELIDCVQFHTGKNDAWQSELEDRPKASEKIKGDYRLKVAQFRIKVRNIAGDEIIYDYNGKKLFQAV